MNKETVSHYGWIVVLSLVMAVLIAFTTPMGKYVGMAASNIIRGFGRTNINAMSDKNINDMQQKWQDKIDELDNNMIKTNLKQNGKIPSNTTYEKADGTTLSGNNGDSYPSSPSDGDVVVFENTYKYTYSADENGWSMITINKDLNVYPGIFTQIANKDIVNLYEAFRDCINMIQSPAIPSTVKNLHSTFYGCSSLIDVTNLPDSVDEYGLILTFAKCESLTGVPKLPTGAKNLNSTFEGCSSLIDVTNLPDSVDECGLTNTFAYCKSLTCVPKLPTGAKYLIGTFKYCENMSQPPILPEDTIQLDSTFMYCTSLRYTPEFTKDIVSMPNAFDHCTSLETVNPLKFSHYENLRLTFYGCTSLRGNIEIDIVSGSSIYNYNGTFGGRTSSSPYITITGSLSDTWKKALANTGENVRYLDSSGILRDKNGNAV